MERTIFDPDNYLSRNNWRKTAASEYLSILGLVVLAAFIYGCARRGTGQRARIIGAVWFFAAYLPISNIVQLNATVAEHWLYLPSVGFLLFLGGCALDLPRKFGAGVTATAAIAILALSVRSTIRSSDWSNEEKFYKRTLAAGGTSCRVGVNLGQIYANRGEYAIAEKMFRHVLETNPDYLIARNNLANVLVHGAARFEIDLLAHLRRWIRLSRFIEDSERISDLSRLDLQACKLQERGGKGRRHRCCTPNLLELSHRFFATTCPQIDLGKIPTREPAPWLHRIPRPFFELIARRLPLCPVNLVQLGEDLRHGRIIRMAFNKILQVIVARLRRVQLQMGVRYSKERRNHRFARFTFRLFHQRFE